MTGGSLWIDVKLTALPQLKVVIYSKTISLTQKNISLIAVYSQIHVRSMSHIYVFNSRAMNMERTISREKNLNYCNRTASAYIITTFNQHLRVPSKFRTHENNADDEWKIQPTHRRRRMSILGHSTRTNKSYPVSHSWLSIYKVQLVTV